MTETFTCSTCGNNVSVDEDGYAVCWGKPGAMHGERELARPCGICGDTIRTAEICADCAEENDGDAFTRNWGDGSFLLDAEPRGDSA